jgi:hypothetical protein
LATGWLRHSSTRQRRDHVSILRQRDKDVPAVAAEVRKGPTFLYVEVDDFEAIRAATAGMNIYLPERTTFYGFREIGVKDPAGHFITFAHFEKPA